MGRYYYLQCETEHYALCKHRLDDLIFIKISEDTIMSRIILVRTELSLARQVCEKI